MNKKLFVEAMQSLSKREYRDFKSQLSLSELKYLKEAEELVEKDIEKHNYESSDAYPTELDAFLSYAEVDEKEAKKVIDSVGGWHKFEDMAASCDNDDCSCFDEIENPEFGSDLAKKYVEYEGLGEFEGENFPPEVNSFLDAMDVEDKDSALELFSSMGDTDYEGWKAFTNCAKECCGDGECEDCSCFEDVENVDFAKELAGLYIKFEGDVEPSDSKNDEDENDEF